MVLNGYHQIFSCRNVILSDIDKTANKVFEMFFVKRPDFGKINIFLGLNKDFELMLKVVVVSNLFIPKIKEGVSVEVFTANYQANIRIKRTIDEKQAKELLNLYEYDFDAFFDVLR